MAIFHFVLIRPSHYDAEGYVIQWLRSGIPSNTLAALNGLAIDCADRKILGAEVEIRVTPIDEANTKVDVDRLAQMIQRDGGHGLIGLAGVQTNQYPRALDIGRKCRQRGLQVCIGGFHVSGILAMLPGPTPELTEATDLGISLYAGESETRIDEVLIDAFNNRLKPLYNYLDDLPNLDGEPPPFMPVDRVYKTLSRVTSFDAGRGCPFVCSFCSIINVHGRKSRFRGPDDVERVIRDNRAQGISLGKVLGSNLHYALVPELEGIHPLEAGLYRVRRRKDRRPGMPIENPFVFYPKYSWRFLRIHWKAAQTLLRFHRVRKALDSDADAVNYTDTALTDVSEKDLEELEMFSQTSAARAAVQVHKEKRRARS